jgi:hypothetical protein
MNLKYIPAQGKFPSGEEHWTFDPTRMPFVYHKPSDTFWYSDLGAFHYPILSAMGSEEEHGAEVAHNNSDYIAGDAQDSSIQTYGPESLPDETRDKALEIYNELGYYKHGAVINYHCPHCNDGPFSATEWWEHFQIHNAPWLQAHDPKNLERTDLGYGEDLKTTTVPTHDLPNEEGFTPEKFGAQRIKRDDIWNLYPNASEYEEVHTGSHPFIYMPESNQLSIGDP